MTALRKLQKLPALTERPTVITTEDGQRQVTARIDGLVLAATGATVEDAADRVLEMLAEVTPDAKG